MTPGQLRDHVLGKPGAWQDKPWEWDGDPVVKVHRKIFAFVGQEFVGVKCGAGREEADAWLQRFPDDATPMPTIGRTGWNSLRIEGAIPDDELLAAVDESYARVIANVPKRHRPEGWDQ